MNKWSSSSIILRFLDFIKYYSKCCISHKGMNVCKYIRNGTVSKGKVFRSEYIYSAICLAAARKNKGVVTVHAVGKIVYNLKLENSILNLIIHAT